MMKNFQNKKISNLIDNKVFYYFASQYTIEKLDVFPIKIYTEMFLRTIYQVLNQKTIRN